MTEHDSGREPHQHLRDVAAASGAAMTSSARNSLAKVCRGAVMRGGFDYYLSVAGGEEIGPLIFCGPPTFAVGHQLSRIGRSDPARHHTPAKPKSTLTLV